MAGGNSFLQHFVNLTVARLRPKPDSGLHYFQVYIFSVANENFVASNEGLEVNVFAGDGIGKESLYVAVNQAIQFRATESGTG